MPTVADTAQILEVIERALEKSGVPFELWKRVRELLGRVEEASGALPQCSYSMRHGRMQNESVTWIHEISLRRRVRSILEAKFASIPREEQARNDTLPTMRHPVAKNRLELPYETLVPGKAMVL